MIIHLQASFAQISFPKLQRKKKKSLPFKLFHNYHYCYSFRYSSHLDHPENKNIVFCITQHAHACQTLNSFSKAQELLHRTFTGTNQPSQSLRYQGRKTATQLQQSTTLSVTLATSKLPSICDIEHASIFEETM